MFEGSSNKFLLIRVIVIGFIILTVLSVGMTEGNSNQTVINAYKVANCDTAVLGDDITIRISITNLYHDVIYNVTIVEEIPDVMELTEVSEPDANIENVTDKFTYSYGSLISGGTINLTLTYNVTETEATTITIAPTKISYLIPDGAINQTYETNSLSLAIRKYVTETSSKPLLPEVNQPGDPIFAFIGYTLPLVAFAISVIIIRKLQKRS